jgi:hypothetical protein
MNQRFGVNFIDEMNIYIYIYSKNQFIKKNYKKK